jgi:hypothetical protein
MIRKFGFFGTIGIVAVCLLVLAGLGLYFGWFSISTSTTGRDAPDVHLTLNKPKVKQDVKAAEEGAKHSARAVTDQVHDLLGEKTIVGPIHEIAVAKQELTIQDKEKQDVTIKVVASTSIKIGDKDSSFSDLTADDPVSVKYEAKKDGNVAKTITVQKKS